MPTDGSEHSERAIERGIELARLCGAKVTGIHVVPDYRLTSRYRKGLLSLIMDSEASRGLHRASIPVLTFRALMSADHPDKRPHKWSDLVHSKAEGSDSTVRL